MRRAESDSVAVDPTGKFVYVGNQTNQSVSAYTIDTTTGGLTPVTGSPFALANSNPMALAVDPNGTHLYVASSNGGVEGYTIDTTTGALAAVGGSPYATECCTMFGGIAVDATGRFLYLQNYVQGQVYGFSVDQVSGALTPLSGSPFASGVNAYAVAIDASNRFLYVGSQDSTSAVVALAIHQTTGALTAVPGSPFAGPAVQALVTTGAGAASSATLVSVALQPSPLTITTSQLGGTTQLLLIGTYSDGTTRSLTESASWTSSLTTVAHVSTKRGTKAGRRRRAMGRRRSRRATAGRRRPAR